MRKRLPSPWKKRFFTWPISGVMAWFAYHLIGVFPIDLGSAVLGKLFRFIGPQLPISKRARIHMRTCFPSWNEIDLEANVRDMWENLGRAAAEFPHIQNLDVSGRDKRVEVIGVEHIHSLRDDGKPGIVFSAHLGNWELLPMLAHPNGLDMHFVYRALNSPLAEKVLRRHYNKLSERLIPKGREGAIQMAHVLRDGGHLAIMVDQKLNEGLDIPFFGKPAKTSTALASFALRHRCPVVPARVERLSGANFRVTFYPAINLPNSGMTQADLVELMTQVNKQIESWIRDTPSQWLWLHRRWGK